PETGRMDGGLGQLLKGLGNGNFLPVPPKKSGIIARGEARSLADLDLDNDGRLDLAFARNDTAPEIYLHNPNASGNTENRSLRILLKGSKGNPTGIGSKITLHVRDGNTQSAEIHAGSGYLTQTPAGTTFDLGPEEAAAIEVQWPNGRTSTTQVSAGIKKIIVSLP
ncbi:MAG: ASPIC/UnbV domain-containing protein, partial [Candidatus Hydrogenedentota bacterium]